MTATLTAADRLRELIGTAEPGTPLPPLSGELVRCLDLPDDLPDELTIAEVAELTGASAHTLRYYERIGLVEVHRDAGGRRRYDREALGRIVFVMRLRSSDMPIGTIAGYLDLVRQGPHTEPERRAVLEAHRAEIVRRLADLQVALAVVDYKITTYGGTARPSAV